MPFATNVNNVLGDGTDGLGSAIGRQIGIRDHYPATASQDGIEPW